MAPKQTTVGWELVPEHRPVQDTRRDSNRLQEHTQASSSHSSISGHLPDRELHCSRSSSREFHQFNYNSSIVNYTRRSHSFQWTICSNRLLCLLCHVEETCDRQQETKSNLRSSSSWGWGEVYPISFAIKLDQLWWIHRTQSLALQYIHAIAQWCKLYS